MLAVLAVLMLAASAHGAAVKVRCAGCASQMGRLAEQRSSAAAHHGMQLQRIMVCSVLLLTRRCYSQCALRTSSRASQLHHSPASAYLACRTAVLPTQASPSGACCVSPSPSASLPSFSPLNLRAPQKSRADKRHDQQLLPHALPDDIPKLCQMISPNACTGQHVPGAFLSLCGADEVERTGFAIPLACSPPCLAQLVFNALMPPPLQAPWMAKMQ